MSNLSVGVIGIGNMGSAHANCIYKGEIKGMRLAAVCDIDLQKLNAFKKICPNIPSFCNYTDLLESGLVDTVIIAVPHNLHAIIAIDALNADMNVLIEKPADISVTAAKNLNQAAQKSDKVFGIMFNQRTNPLFAKAREIVKSGQLGELKRTVWIITNWYRTQHYYDSGSWRATWAGEGGGVLLNQAPHQLDLWQWICGMPTSVTANCFEGKYHDIEVEDDAIILTRFENGATGAFITSTGEAPGTNRLEITGTLGKLVIEDGVLKWWQLGTDERELNKNCPDAFPSYQQSYKGIRQIEAESAHKGILQNFANACISGEELIAKGTDGILSLTISNAAYLSSWQGGIPVSLPFDEKKFNEILTKKAAASSYRPEPYKEKLKAEYKKRWSVNW